MRYVNDQPVAEHYTEFGVRYLDGTIYECADQDDAELQAELHFAEVVTHEVYVTEWKTVS